jgi:hypothetical protein
VRHSPLSPTKTFPPPVGRHIPLSVCAYRGDDVYQSTTNAGYTWRLGIISLGRQPAARLGDILYSALYF